jgi:hypothetical protein
MSALACARVRTSGSARGPGAVVRTGLAVLSVALVAGCGGSSGLDSSAGASASPSAAASTSASASASLTTPTASSSPSTSATTSAADVAGAAALADWRRYNQGFERAVHTRNSRVPAMLHYATAKRQLADRTRIQTMHSLNIVFRGNDRIWVKGVTADTRRATVRTCYSDNAGYYIYKASGRPIHKVTRGWSAFGIRMLHRGGRWQVDSVDKMKFSCKGAR